MFDPRVPIYQIWPLEHKVRTPLIYKDHWGLYTPFPTTSKEEGHRQKQINKAQGSLTRDVFTVLMGVLLTTGVFLNTE